MNVKKTLFIFSLSVWVGWQLLPDSDPSVIEEQAMVSESSADKAIARSKADINAVSPVSKSNEGSVLSPIHFKENQTFAYSTTESYETASQFGQLPKHMRGVRIEAIAFDQNNNLVIDERIKNVTEFFLMASDTEGYEQAVERLYEYLSLTLPEQANEQARDLIARYLEYKANLDTHSFALSSDLTDPDVLGNIKAALAEKQQLRRQYMGEEISDALFSHEESYDAYSIARIEINTNPQLSEQQKREALSKEEQHLPAELAEKMRYQRQEQELKQRVAVLQMEQGREQEIYELRKAFYGESVATRMAYLEDNSAAWQMRVNTFYETQQAILQSEGNQSEKHAQISTLRQEMFTPKEQIKLAVQSIRGQAG